MLMILRRWKSIFGCAVLGGVALGCRLDGQWKAVGVDPPGSRPPIEQLSLGRDGSYSVTWTEEGEKRGSSGQYRWNGRQLSVAQEGYEPKKYRLKRRWDGKMVLSPGGKEKGVAVTLERVDPRTQNQAAAVGKADRGEGESMATPPAGSTPSNRSAR